MKKSTLLGISIIGVSLICSGTYFERKEEIKSDPSNLIGETKEFDGEGWAYPAYSYTNSPTNEPKYKNTTTFTNVGSYSQKTATYDRINVEEVWESYRGESVKVAVIDTGCRTDHQEFDGTNISKDSYDIGNKTSTITDTSGHGTDTAACVAAAINGVGGTGIAPNVELYIIRAVNSTNTFPTEYLKSALNYCLENEVDVINMSIQGYPSTFSYEYVEDMNGQTYSDTVSPSMTKTTLDDEINACYEKGITIVGAAGNYNTTTPAYPAANDHVIAVASTGLNSETAKAGFSNYGDWVDVCAPGYVIVPGSTGTSSYCLNLGTSFSAPIVTGAIALYKSKYPSAKPDQIEKALKASCNKLTWSGSGAGQIDVKVFLDIAPESDVESVTLSEHEKTLTVGETYQLSATVLPSGANQELTYESSDSSICSVSNTGLVEGVAKGTATIKVISAENSSKYDSIIINVEEAQSQFVEKEGTPTMTLNSEVVEKGGTATGKNNGIKIGSGSTIKITVPKEATKLNFYLGAWNKESAQITIAPTSNVSKTSITPSADAGISNNSPFTLSTNSMSAYKQTIELSNLTKDTEISFTTSSSKRAVIWNITYSYLEGSSQETPTLTGIQVSNSHRTFTVGETFVKETVTATYSDGTTADVTNDATFSGYTANQSGQQTIKVAYEGKEITYTVTVSEPVVTNYTVTFNSNGGSGTMASETTNGSSYVTPTCSFTKEGYTFDKWALNSTTGNKYAAGATINNISSDITLYAIWTEKSSSSDDFDGYYSNIDENSSTLLADLRTLNLGKRTKTAGYNNMGTGTSTNPDNSPYMYTDYDPSTIQYRNGQPYGTKILSFYSGNSTTGWNKEHVWPASRLTGGRDGNIVDDDIYMARPTISSENSNRGNSVFYEGMAHSSNGWDPVTAFGTSGVYTNIRGECARIIFYCMTVDSSLVLNESTSNSGNNMGRLTDLLKWNLENPVNDREVRRQSGGEYLQGNRNAFVDHPEYACKIWGNTSDATRQICSMDPVTNKELVDLSVSGTPSKTVYQKGENFSPNGLTVTATFDDGTSSNVTSSVVWTPSPLDVGVTEVTGTYTYLNETKTVTITGLTVNPWTVVDGDYTIEFKNSSADGSSELTTTAIMGDNYLKMNTLASEMTSISKVFAGTYGLKIGSSNSAGNFVINLVDGAKNGIKSIDIYSKKYGSDSGTIKFTLGSKTGSFTPTATGSKQTQTFNETISAQTLKIETSSKRGYVQKVVLHVEDSSTPKVTSVTLDPKTLSFDLYQSTAAKTITATVLGDSGVDTSVVWTSNRESVATVVNGVVTPVAVGEATITATSTADSTKFDTCVVTISDSTPAAVSGVTLNKPSTTLVIGSSETLIATVNPPNAGNKNVTWSTSNPSVATVSNGTVNAIAAGPATITVTTEEGGFTDSCIVTVTAAPVITYQLEADQETVPYMSGTNHQVSVGVKLYQYSNGIKGSQVASSTGSVDTSVLGSAKISYTYESVTYETSVKVTNNGASTYVGTSIQGSEKTETLTSALFTATTTNYTNFTNVSVKNGSGAIYAGNSAKDKNKNIQLRSSNSNSGIVQTESGGKVTSIKITVGSGSNTINVYGKNTAYSSAADLYGGNQGTLIGSLSATGTLTFATKNQFDYIGIRSNSGAIYISSIEITCGSAGVSYPATPEDQASAWADYFIKLTGGGEFDGPCKLGTPEAKKTALQQVWGELKSEYVYMVEGSKTAFCSTDATETIAEAVQHYRYIVNTYGLEDFAEVPQVSSSNKLIPISDSEPFIIGVITMVGLAAIGGYFVFRRRREE